MSSLALLERRRAMMGASGGSLPYDAEIEWLKTPYSQGPYIDTNIEPAFSDRIEIDFYHNKGAKGTLFGCTGDTEIAAVPDDTGCFVKFFTKSGANLYSYSVPTAGQTPAFVHIVYDNGRQLVYCDGKLLGSAAMGTNTAIGVTFTLFCRKNSTAAKSTQSAIGCVKIIRNNVPILDFIPVRVGTTGYMYDRVSGQLFGNDGSGDFVLGNDK